MVAGLLDTTILVDLLRKYPPADSWINQQQNLGITTIVWLEVLQGATNKTSQNISFQLLKRFTRIELEVSDVQWAIEAVLAYNLSHSLDGFDALIASVSYRLQVPLYTRNLKHFRHILGNLAQSPYP
jgi:predicted nucleic acid-binding protein